MTNPHLADRVNFADFHNRIRLADELDVFSVDRTEHRNRREAQALGAATLETAYRALGLERRREHNRIAAEMEAHLTSGVWAKSTGEYSARCRTRDREVLRAVWLNEGAVS